MTALDDELVPAVLTTINTVGKLLTYKFKASGSYDPLKADVVRGNPTSYDRLSIPPFAGKDMFGLTDSLRKSERVTGVAASGLEFTPVPGMSVIIDSVTYRCQVVEPVYSGEQVCLWLFGLKRGGN